MQYWLLRPGPKLWREIAKKKQPGRQKATRNKEFQTPPRSRDFKKRTAQTIRRIEMSKKMVVAGALMMAMTLSSGFRAWAQDSASSTSTSPTKSAAPEAPKPVEA